MYMAECHDMAGNLYAKVGMAENVLSRVPSIQVGCPHEFHRVRFVYLPTRDKARLAERRCHRTLRKYHARGEWFMAKAGDVVAMTALDCFSEVIAAVAKEPVKIGCLDMQMYSRIKKRNSAVYGRNFA